MPFTPRPPAESKEDALNRRSPPPKGSRRFQSSGSKETIGASFDEGEFDSPVLEPLSARHAEDKTYQHLHLPSPTGGSKLDSPLSPALSPRSRSRSQGLVPLSPPSAPPGPGGAVSSLGLGSSGGRGGGESKRGDKEADESHLDALLARLALSAEAGRAAGGADAPIDATESLSAARGLQLSGLAGAHLIPPSPSPPSPPSPLSPLSPFCDGSLSMAKAQAAFAKMGISSCLYESDDVEDTGQGQGQGQGRGAVDDGDDWDAEPSPTAPPSSFSAPSSTSVVPVVPSADYRNNQNPSYFYLNTSTYLSTSYVASNTNKSNNNSSSANDGSSNSNSSVGAGGAAEEKSSLPPPAQDSAPPPPAPTPSVTFRNINLSRSSGPPQTAPAHAPLGPRLDDGEGEGAWGGLRCGPPGFTDARCVQLLVGGPASLRGLRSSAFTRCICNHTLCLKCNFTVQCFPAARWSPGTDYLFLRNAAPSEARLQQGLVPAPASCAYNCQCSWLDCQDEGPPAGAMWACAGHRVDLPGGK